jgi:hypothetical protein
MSAVGVLMLFEDVGENKVQETRLVLRSKTNKY